MSIRKLLQRILKAIKGIKRNSEITLTIETLKRNWHIFILMTFFLVLPMLGLYLYAIISSTYETKYPQVDFVIGILIPVCLSIPAFLAARKLSREKSTIVYEISGYILEAKKTLLNFFS